MCLSNKKSHSTQGTTASICIYFPTCQPLYMSKFKSLLFSAPLSFYLFNQSVFLSFSLDSFLFFLTLLFNCSPLCLCLPSCICSFACSVFFCLFVLRLCVLLQLIIMSLIKPLRWVGENVHGRNERY